MKSKWEYRDMEKYKEYKRKTQRNYRKRTGAGQYPAREYTLEEDRMILERSMTDRELGIKIQRSVGAIQKRRHRLKKED